MYAGDPPCKPALVRYTVDVTLPHVPDVRAAAAAAAAAVVDEVDAFLTKRGAQSEHEATLQVMGGVTSTSSC
jgi:hypothetical protein